MLNSRVFSIFFSIFLHRLCKTTAKNDWNSSFISWYSNICRQDSNNRIFFYSFYSHNRLLVRASIVAYIAISRFRSIQKKSCWLLSFMFVLLFWMVTIFCTFLHQLFFSLKLLILLHISEQSHKFSTTRSCL